jgi:hypothetical protein
MYDFADQSPGIFRGFEQDTSSSSSSSSFSSAGALGINKASPSHTVLAELFNFSTCLPSSQGFLSYSLATPL